tara:strand:- start:158 stop:736 length:579 start_codon:yes stop_codon:yes gene_type:complete
MDFLIKLVPFILLLSSCSTDVFNTFNDHSKFLLRQSQITNIASDKSIFRYNDKQEYLAILTNDIWRVDNFGISYKLTSGKITYSLGLKNNFKILGYKGFLGPSNSSALITFTNPASDTSYIFFSYEFISQGVIKSRVNDSSVAYRLVKESFSSPALGWKGNNYYWIDNNNSVLTSKQILDPFDTKIRIISLF